MIYIVTVHYRTDKWIDLQMRYIRKHIHEPYRIYACINGVKQKYTDLYYFYSEEEGSHAEKLKYLASEIIPKSNDDDILMFIDGDAFPINSELVPFVKEKITKHKLVAIRRDENAGDIQPHPSFCATTVGFWKQIQGDWGRGYCWKNSQGKEVTDIGGNLLRILNDNNIDWFPLTRTNKKDLHPIWFGIYGNMIYHHGAGFRPPTCRSDATTVLDKIALKIGREFQKHRGLRRVGNKIISGWILIRLPQWERIYRQICMNEQFYLMFQT
jgi:hypothetical protein